MKINGSITIAEGGEIKNLTAPSGPEFPSEPNDAMRAMTTGMSVFAIMNHVETED